jgi:deoxycytidine triphosphate deaminase
MIFVADDIKQAISNGGLIIDGDANRVRGCSYDLTIGTIFWENKILKGPDTFVIIPPGGVVSILTKEELQLPDDVCATAFAINKMSSEGFLVLNPGHVDPGFKGPLTVKALNIRKVAMPLHAGASIFTVIFQKLPKTTSTFGHNYSSRIDRERSFNETIVQTAPRTFFEMMEANRDGPYPGRHEVNSMIRRHWLSWISAGASLLTLLLAGVAAYKSVYPTTLQMTTHGVDVTTASSGQGTTVAPPPQKDQAKQIAPQEGARGALLPQKKKNN